jgi:predicted HicB family RNase H-like nuclease
MIKDKDIVIRVEPEFKQKLKEKAQSLGLSLSSFVRLVIAKELKKNDNKA